MSNQKDIGDKCIECLKDTSFGSGLFVNRIPADDGENSGYLCPECNRFKCDRCNDLIATDEDICPYDVYGEDNDRAYQEFSDGSYRVHEDCLTKNEKKSFQEVKND